MVVYSDMPGALSLNAEANKDFTRVLVEKTAESGEKIDTKEENKLSYTWVLFEQLKEEQKYGKQGVYNTGLINELLPISSIENFWLTWIKLPQPSQLLMDGAKYVSAKGKSVESLWLFREGIAPEWEHTMNQDGGEFRFTCSKKNILSLDNGAAKLDEAWNNLVMGMLGGVIEPSSMITGVRLLDRLQGKMPNIRIEVWFTNVENLATKDKEHSHKTKEELIENLKCQIEDCMTNGLNGEKIENFWGEASKFMHNGD